MLIRDVGFFTAQTSYAANPVNFDGTADYLTRGAALTGAANTTMVTGSGWARKTTLATGEQRIFVSAGLRLHFQSFNHNFRIVGQSATPAVILNLSSTGTIFNGTAWHHFAFSFDLVNAAKRFIYIDDVSNLAVTTYNTTGTLDLAGPANWSIGATEGAAAKWPGDLADIQVWFGQYIDLSVEANRRLFITATGEPVDPAVAAASALGAPIVRLAGPTGTWHVNQGTGGGFTVTGALSDGTGPVEV